MSMRRVLSSLVVLGIALALLPLILVARDAWLREQVRLLGDEQAYQAARARLLRARRNAVPPLIDALSSDDSSIPPRAANLLGELGDRRAVQPLASALTGGGHNLRLAAAEALGKIADERAIEPLGQAAEIGNWAARQALETIRTPAARRRLALVFYRQARADLDALHASRRRMRLPRPWHAEHWYDGHHFAWSCLYHLDRAEEACPSLPEIQRGVGECELLGAQYGKAAERLRGYLATRPEDGDARELLKEAEQGAALLAKAVPYLPAGYLPYEAMECDLWNRGARDLVALAAKRITWPEKRALWDPEVVDCCVAALRARRSGYDRVYLSPPVGADCYITDWDQVGLLVGDLDGDRRTDIVAAGFHPGGSCVPVHVNVFSPARGSLRRTLSAHSEIPPFIGDVDHDGDVEICVFYNVGDAPCHAEQPYWTDIYSSNGSYFVLCNRCCPDEYRRLAEELEALNRKVPYSPENLFYLGYAREICGKLRQALMAYRAAEANLATRAGRSAPWSTGGWDAQHARELRQRRRALEQRLGR